MSINMNQENNNVNNSKRYNFDPLAFRANPATKKKYKGKACVTQADVANEAGVAPSIVSVVFGHHGEYYKGGHVPPETEKKVRDAAEELGYKTREERRQQREQEREMDYLEKRNFPTKEIETQRMKILRAQGCSNQEIAKTTGRCVLTVRRRIGAQEADMTAENRVLGQKKRAQRRRERGQYVADHTVRVFNDLSDKLCETQEAFVKVQNELKDLSRKIEELRPEAEEASKKSKVKMNDTAKCWCSHDEPVSETLH